MGNKLQSNKYEAVSTGDDLDVSTAAYMSDSDPTKLPVVTFLGDIRKDVTIKDTVHTITRNNAHYHLYEATGAPMARFPDVTTVDNKPCEPIGYLEYKLKRFRDITSRMIDAMDTDDIDTFSAYDKELEREFKYKRYYVILKLIIRKNCNRIFHYYTLDRIESYMDDFMYMCVLDHSVKHDYRKVFCNYAGHSSVHDYFLSQFSRLYDVAKKHDSKEILAAMDNFQKKVDDFPVGYNEYSIVSMGTKLHKYGLLKAIKPENREKITSVLKPYELEFFGARNLLV